MADDATLRHDFKNQLGIILGFAELLVAESKPDDPRSADFEEIRRVATAALELVGRVFPAPTDADGGEG